MMSSKYVYSEKHQSVNDLESVQLGFTDTLSTWNYLKTQADTSLFFDKKKNESTKNPIDKNLQQLSNKVLKQIFDKEPNGYWSDED